MEPTIEILIGSPVSGSEAAALRKITSALRSPALVLANFELPRAGSSHQIDFVAITEQRAELIELKAITAPLRGGANGPWEIETSPGFFLPYSGPNPWEQARDAKLALSDAMHDYAKRRPTTPKPARRRYFEQFDASVTIFPALVAGSQVWSGNYKAWVRSFPDTLDALTTRPLPVHPTWGIAEWRAFAIDHLGLVPATLSAAIDVTVFQAHQSLDEYAARLRRSAIAPLLQAAKADPIGKNVVAKLNVTADVVVLGRSGIGKSFHLDHYRRGCFDSNEVPILLNVRHYQRDLNRAIHKTIGQYTRLTPAELLEAGKRIGMRPVLIVDAWNDCPGPMQSDLGDDLGAFKLRYNARLVVASQTVPPHPVLGQASKIEIGALMPEHKRAIFAFHAGQAVEKVPAHCYEPFSTAFDLTIAGRCQTNGAAAQSRAELFDAYVRSVMPSQAARSVLRKLAWHMGEDFRPVLPIADYERLADNLAQQLGVPMAAVDDLLKSRLLAVDREIMAFEHDLLREYFRAEELLRETSLEQLAARLAEPKYAGLAEFVVPALNDDRVVRDLLAGLGVELLNLAFRGWLGGTAKQVIRGECHQVLVNCRDRLSDIEVEVSIGELDSGRRFVSSAHVVGAASASDWERKVCSVIADNLADELICGDFLELLDVGEWALKEACGRAVRELRVKSIAVWRELVHHDVILSHSGPVHPLLYVCHLIHQDWHLHRSDRLPFRQVLLNKVRDGGAGALPLLLLIFDLRYSESVGIADILTIVRQAWDTNIDTLRMEALDLVHSNSRAIREAGHEAEDAVVALLETFDVSKNIILSTQWLEARSCFGGFEIGIDVDSAAEEFRRILAMADAGDDPLYHIERETDPSVTFIEFAASWASTALSKIFEDVFQGAYYDAYESLAESEKRRLLILALHDRHFGMFTDWCMKELGKTGWAGAEDVLCMYGGRIDPKVFISQDRVECFIIANQAWAQISGEPIPNSENSSLDDRAWASIGELIFWLNRKDAGEVEGRVAFLCGELLHVPQALPDVLRGIAHSHKGMGSAPVLGLLLTRYAGYIREALHESLNYEGRLTSVFQHAQFYQRELFLWTISILGDIGDRESIALLRPWADSLVYGRSAIRAIEQIEQRVATSHSRHHQHTS